MPLLVLIPLVWLFTGLFIHHLLKPLQQLSSEVGSRAENDLQPLDSRRVPQEVLPLVAAINRQLQQIRASRKHDQRFIGNAAHELRTPITALTLQMAQLTQPNLTEAERQAQLVKIRSGLQRTQQLFNQLLDMARAQNMPKNTKAATISLLPFLRVLYADLLPMIDAKALDAGVAVAQDYYLNIDYADLYAIFKNLLENAVRYTSEGGRIDIWCEEIADGYLKIGVRDSGCGVPEAEHAHTFEPFYRLEHGESGSGLGLSIVKTLCDKWGLAVGLVYIEPGQNGFNIAVMWPRSAWQYTTI